jgi:hypothetical protein
MAMSFHRHFGLPPSNRPAPTRSDTVRAVVVFGAVTIAVIASFVAIVSFF